MVVTVRRMPVSNLARYRGAEVEPRGVALPLIALPRSQTLLEQPHSMAEVANRSRSLLHFVPCLKYRGSGGG
jgi:hypothetical protein